MQGNPIIDSIEFLYKGSVRLSIGDAVIVPDSNPFFCLISTPVACWYDMKTNTTGLIPLLVQNNGKLVDAQTRLLESSFTSANHSLLVIGEHLNTSYVTTEILGSPPSVSLSLATQVFSTASTVLIIPYKIKDAYLLSLLAAPLASYLNIPILIYDQNEAEIQTVCARLQTTNAYIVGDIIFNLTNVTFTSLNTEEKITNTVLTVIKEQFGEINYLTITNPSDVIPKTIANKTKIQITDHIVNKKIIILNKEFTIIGNDTREYNISIPEGINQVSVYGEILLKPGSFFDKFFSITPLIFLTLTDANGRIVGYANSMAYDIGKTYLETLTCNASGIYTLDVKVFYGIKGGYFIQRGLSFFNSDVDINVTINTLEYPHLPVIPNLSTISPYLTAAHGGLIIANSSGGLTDSLYALNAQGSGTGPWYNESLHAFTNNKVNTTIDQLKKTLEIIETFGLLTEYLKGPAWLAILADTTMIPMYYFGPSQADLPDRGLPSDNPYSLNETLSVGRLVGWDIQDVSVLIARTFFYEIVCGQPKNQNDWHNRFNFVFGEGFGETGGIFHQLPYAKEIKKYGFISKVYGDFRNSRQIIERLKIFTGSNYIEYLGHGDWFWFPASLYGFDIYSKAVDVAHAKNWVFDKPSIFLTSACLMGRTDGLPSNMSIGLAMLHAGCNSFIGATRETGQESGLTTLENFLIINNWSLGEALRGEKQIDQEKPTFYVRVLYGDPAFNPFEPENGFSNQGRPIFIES